MASTFTRSGVFTSPVDYFCLVCECRLRNENDANTHIIKPVHTKNLELTEYFEKNKEDGVRKIKKWYFCEFCNHLMSTAARVRLHIVEPKHVENKSSLVLWRKGNFIVAFTNVFIDDKAWNGFIEDTCVICNTEFENENIHKNETVHIIKLIQSRVEFDTKKNIFRKIDDSSFQCLTCNTVLALTTIDIHFDQSEHKKVYQKQIDSSKITEPDEIKIPNTSTNNEKNIKTIVENKTVNKTSKTDDKENVKQVNSRSNIKRESDNCGKNQQRQENEISNNTLKTENTDSKTKVNNNNTIDCVPTSDAKICEILDTKNYITTDENGKTWCILCNWVMDPNVIEVHINDLHHQTILKLHKARITKINATGDSTEISRNDKTVAANSVTKENEESKDNILDFIVIFQKNDIYINFEFHTAVCKKCSMGLDFDVKAIDNHIKEHKKEGEQKDEFVSIQLPSGVEVTKNEGTACKTTSLYTTPVLEKESNKENIEKDNVKSSKDKKSLPSGEIKEDLETYAKDNNMKYTPGKSNVYCNRCKTTIPSRLRSLKEHVAGLAHKSRANNEHLAIVKSKPKAKQSEKESNLLKIPITSFVMSCSAVDGLHKYLIFNEKIVISLLSFSLIVNCENRLRCLVCETSFHRNHFKFHVGLSKHENALNETPVVLIDNEFIREIRSGCFHCGLCNLLQYSWDTMENHLLSTAHKESKNAAQWRLQHYKSLILKNRFEKKIREQFIMQMLFNRFLGWNRGSDTDSD